MSTIMNHPIPEDAYQSIGRMIASDESVVGIDAKKTHILIIYKLEEISGRLDKLEAEIAKLKQNS
jgi:hypothetical protein